MKQVHEQSEDEYLKGALNTKVVDREEQVRALNEIERAQIERRAKLMQNIEERRQPDHYEAIPGLPAQPSNQQRHPRSSTGEQNQYSDTNLSSPSKLHFQLVYTYLYKYFCDFSYIRISTFRSASTPPL